MELFFIGAPCSWFLEKNLWHSKSIGIVYKRVYLLHVYLKYNK